MSNQRAAKTHKASGMDNGADMQIYQFFKQARMALEESGNEDAAFYFEQCEDWIRSGKSLNTLQAIFVLGYTTAHAVIKIAKKYI